MTNMTGIVVSMWNIYFTVIGIIDIPIEKEMLQLMEEIRNNKSANNLP